MPIGLGLLIGGAALSLGSAAINGVRANKERKRAQRGLANLMANPISPYARTAEMQNYYTQALGESRNPMGVSGADRLAFQQNLGRQNQTQFNNAISISGGNAASAIRGALNSAGLNTVNNFAQFNSNLRRQNRQSAFGRLGMANNQFQNIANMNTQANLQAQAAYGAAIAQQKQNISNAWSSVGQLGGMAAGYGMAGMTGMGGGGMGWGSMMRNRRINKWQRDMGGVPYGDYTGGDPTTMPPNPGQDEAFLN